uniref:WAP domain-containing protein n=1 Tax=Anolis carolinensis TaxID=28377 RepID=A0A803TXY5_ANOCA
IPSADRLPGPLRKDVLQLLYLSSFTEKPGRCPSPHPPPGRVTHCGLLCSSDYNCPGIQKCCRYGCSASCTNPLRGTEKYGFLVIYCMHIRSSEM